MKRRTFLGTSILTPIALATAACGGGGGGGGSTPPVDVDPGIPADTPENIKTAWDAMRRATTYMDSTISIEGSYPWHSDPTDLSQRWNEMKANPRMCGFQNTGTPHVGDALLDAYHATGDELFYKAAERTAYAMVEAQQTAGGWGYIYDFDGDASLQEWFKTTGYNGWRLEEFQHYYGNATYDDSVSADCGQFMLRMALEKQNPDFVASSNKMLEFLINSQLKNNNIADGGWPQRFPRYPGATSWMPAPNWDAMAAHAEWTHLAPGGTNGDYSSAQMNGGGHGGIGRYTGIFSGMEDRDYTGFLTFNDNALGANIRLMFMHMLSSGDMSLKDYITKAMDSVINTLFIYDGNPANAIDPSTGALGWALAGTTPQAGWSMQHLSMDTVDAYGVSRKAGMPAAARRYEPRGLCPAVCTANIGILLDFFRMTGNRKYLVGLDKVMDWLDNSATRMPIRYQQGTVADGKDPESILTGTHPRVVELYSNRGRFPHRYGTNIHNGAYYFDYDWKRTPVHYGSSSNANTTSLRAQWNGLWNLPEADIARMVAASPLSVLGKQDLPKYYRLGGEPSYRQMFKGAVKGFNPTTQDRVDTIVADLGDKNYWITTQFDFNNEYGDAPISTAPYYGKEYMTTEVGDRSDTSPFGLNAVGVNGNTLGKDGGPGFRYPKGMPGYETDPAPRDVVEADTFAANLMALASVVTEPIAAVNSPDYITGS